MRSEDIKMSKALRFFIKLNIYASLFVTILMYKGVQYHWWDVSTLVVCLPGYVLLIITLMLVQLGLYALEERDAILKRNSKCETIQDLANKEDNDVNN